jgi:hypothetical protein
MASKNINNTSIGVVSTINNSTSILNNWQNNNQGDIYYTTGGVVVGKSYKNSTNYAVDVSGVLNCNGLYLNNAPMDISGVLQASHLILNNSELVPVWSNPSGGSTYFIGNVGVNNSSPGSALAVTGDAAVTGNFTLGGSMTCNGLTVPTQATTDNSTKAASTAYVKNVIAINAGPTGPTGPAGSNGSNGATGPTGATGTSYFTQSGSNIYYTAGNLGIGTTSPGYPLDVPGNARFGGNVYLNATYPCINFSGSISSIYFNSNAYLQYSGTSMTSNAENKLSLLVGGYQQTVIQQGTQTFYGPYNNTGLGTFIFRGKVGINNTSPSYFLDMIGDGKITGNIFCTNNIGIGTLSPGAPLEVSGNAIASSLNIRNNNGGSNYRINLANEDTHHYIYSTGTGSDQMYFGEWSGTFNFVMTNIGNNVAGQVPILTITPSAHTINSGSLSFNGGQGGGANNGVYNIDGGSSSNQQYSLSSGATVNFTNFSGQIIINDITHGYIGTWLVGGAAGYYLGGHSALSGVMAYIGTGSYYQFTAPSTGNYTFFSIRTRGGA